MASKNYYVKYPFSECFVCWLCKTYIHNSLGDGDQNFATNFFSQTILISQLYFYSFSCLQIIFLMACENALLIKISTLCYEFFVVLRISFKESWWYVLLHYFYHLLHFFLNEIMFILVNIFKTPLGLCL